MRSRYSNKAVANSVIYCLAKPFMQTACVCMCVCMCVCVCVREREREKKRKEREREREREREEGIDTSFRSTVWKVVYGKLTYQITGNFQQGKKHFLFLVPYM